ncbi:P-loop NTPase fold protein [Ruegeria sp. HKCCD6157]|uniref:KAP family P-loop NTPase fold protein n=1 Tax=Ruegeria sp. HKCCD6157 TaxID=2690707 RepID=UPI00149200B3|nr:P-loop NTPase fold protein [Ruegeria sp. HKCCD6157]NOE28279.1 hypothetical protein [Ruegeria sp. HKCCD6157]
MEKDTRLTIPEPEITLYQDGFDKHDKLSRKPTGDKLSELVERIDDPLVIALDGAWGSGKSFFLKCWVGEHLKREKNTTQTVYFDAFKHDFLDDPLIALTGAIAERFEEADDKPAQKAWKKAKQVAPALGRALVRTGVSVATAGLVTKADALTDAAINTVSSELDGAVAEFWQRENGKRAAMAAFRQALIDLTEPNNDGYPTRKLIVVIDELDRCRPDFSLCLLEVTKHFFSVDGVHFVLGVNLSELQNSVRARYSENSDAEKYLQKFTSVTLPLSGAKVRQGEIGVYSKYYEHISEQYNFDNDWRYDWIRNYLLMIDHHTSVSLRDIEKLISQVIVSPEPETASEGTFHIYSGLSVLRIIKPNLIKDARFNRLEYKNVDEVFRLSGRDAEPGFFRDAKISWSACTLGQGDNLRSSPSSDHLDRLEIRKNRATLPARVIAECFDTFILPNGS